MLLFKFFCVNINYFVITCFIIRDILIMNYLFYYFRTTTFYVVPEIIFQATMAVVQLQVAGESHQLWR